MANEKLTTRSENYSEWYNQVIQRAESLLSQFHLEDVMNQLEEKNGMLSSLQAEVEDLKGQLKVYQDKINELLSDEAQEAKAFEMLDDQHQGRRNHDPRG